MTRDDISGEDRWRRSRIVVSVPSPAAGADWSLAVPGGHTYQILTIAATLTTSAAVATRASRLLFGDGTASFLDLPASATQVASLARKYAWWPTAEPVAVGNAIEAAIPPLTLPAGWTVASATDLIDVADQWSGIKLAVIDTWARWGTIELDALPDILVGIVDL